MRRFQSRAGAIAVIATMLVAPTWMVGCGGDDGGPDEALEEIRDEAGDAREEIEDEIDDHS